MRKKEERGESEEQQVQPQETACPSGLGGSQPQQRSVRGMKVESCPGSGRWGQRPLALFFVDREKHYEMLWKLFCLVQIGLGQAGVDKTEKV